MPTITKLMLQEHGKIRSLLEELDRTYDKEQFTKLFNKFKWTLEKHFFIEEKVIFGLYEGEENIENINTLLKEHKNIFLLVKNAEDALDEGDFDKSKFQDLKTTLESHADFESNVLYPRLDEELDEDLKKLMIDRANEIIKE